MLAIPDEVKSCAKLLSPADEPSGTPSSRIWVPEAPSSTPLPPLSSSAPRCRTHGSPRRILPLLTLPFAAGSPLSAAALLVSQIASPVLPADSLLSTLVSSSPRHKPPRARCTHLNNRFPCQFGNIVAAAVANFVLPLHARPPEMLGRIAILPGMSFT